MPEPDCSPYVMLAPADALAEYLATVKGLAGVPVIVARQKNLKAEIDTVVAKGPRSRYRDRPGRLEERGARGWRPPSRPAALRLDLDDADTAQRWHPRESADGPSRLRDAARHQPDPNGCQARWETAVGRYGKHPNHQVYEFPASFPLDLPAVEFVEEEDP